MVVIAIVTLLSAVAVPAYQDYARKAKIASAVNALGNLAIKGQEYYDIHGSFPDPNDPNSQEEYGLSAPPGGGQPDSVDEYMLPPYIALMSINGHEANENNPGECAFFTAIGYISNTDNTGAFTSALNLPYLYYGISFFNVNGTWRPLCSYYEVKTDLSYTQGNFLTDCYNAIETTQADEFNAQFQALLNSCS